ncbi:hypothetical protein HRG_004653 [Hirsutella rhossiliensis]|uniref:Uncharacterized protein n=1 Tax=Hirsutella rhossiliensis TaxID=111463 RepID=A0A9P8MZN4_9HYPO|nr:uncharacterized protein HRG_04653 [Hirsutella rhossiliensis]KAH0964225.1 hypothetical protein HRG_04653 [Hirsutella rhossiliensis]
MCFTTDQFPEQASDLLLVNKINHSLGLEKERLYVGLYVRGSAPKMPRGEDEYHWAFLAGPKQHPKSGSRHIMYHAKERLVMSGNPPQLRPEWQYVNDSDRAAMLLVRIVVGKIMDRDHLEQILRNVPLRTDDPDWNCVLWMEDAFQRVLDDGQALASSVRDWESVRCKAMWYVSHKKAAHRFDGKDSNIVLDPMKPATWDMLRNMEVTP